MRKLNLQKETLAELTSDELTLVVGGQVSQLCVTDPCITPPVSGLWCLTRRCVE